MHLSRLPKKEVGRIKILIKMASQINEIKYNIASININTVSSINKIDTLRSFIRLLDLDIILLQEVDNDQLEMYGFDTITNVDESRRGTAILIREQIQYTHVEKSLDDSFASE
jgi:exonuclease III